MGRRIVLAALVLAASARPQEFLPFNSKPYLTLTDSAASSIWVNWNTEQLESTIVAYGATPDLADTIRAAGAVYHHHARIRGLSPGAECYYRVLPNGDLKRFQTFAEAADSFQFAVIGDTRTDSSAHQSVADRMAGFPSAFYVHLGDYVGTGGSASEWQTHFNVEDTVSQDRAILPAIGNHEDPFWPFDSLFSRPDTFYYYSADYANSHIVVLNSSEDLYAGQRDWLRADLMAAQSDSSIDWIVCAFHRPAYSSGPHGSQADIQEAWCPLFDSNAVDLVFAGHDHDYERTFPINGVTHVVSGGGGAPLHPVGSNPWTAYAESTFQFCLVKIRGRNLSIYSIRPDGSVCDSAVISKPVRIEETNDRRRAGIDLSPNPFRAGTVIRWTTEDGRGKKEKPSLRIYDVSGRLVRSVSSIVPRPPFIVQWNGADSRGNDLPAGVYFIEIVSGGIGSHRLAIKVR